MTNEIVLLHFFEKWKERYACLLKLFCPTFTKAGNENIHHNFYILLGSVFIFAYSISIKNK